MSSRVNDKGPDVTHAVERVVFVILVALTIISLAASLANPAMFVAVFVFAVAAAGMFLLSRRHDVQRAEDAAHAAGAHGHVTHTGKIEHVEGSCPSAVVLRDGQEFSVADGRVWPALCVHAERAILDAVPRLQQNTRPLPGPPLHYGDASHQFDFTLVDVRDEANAA